MSETELFRPRPQLRSMLGVSEASRVDRVHHDGSAKGKLCQQVDTILVHGFLSSSSVFVEQGFPLHGMEIFVVVELGFVLYMVIEKWCVVLI